MKIKVTEHKESNSTEKSNGIDINTLDGINMLQNKEQTVFKSDKQKYQSANVEIVTKEF